MGQNSDASSDSDDNDEDSNDDDRVELVDQFVSSGLHVERIISVSCQYQMVFRLIYADAVIHVIRWRSRYSVAAELQNVIEM